MALRARELVAGAVTTAWTAAVLAVTWIGPSGPRPEPAEPVESGPPSVTRPGVREAPAGYGSDVSSTRSTERRDAAARRRAGRPGAGR